MFPVLRLFYVKERWSFLDFVYLTTRLVGETVCGLVIHHRANDGHQARRGCTPHRTRCHTVRWEACACVWRCVVSGAPA
jgi:hypothetical protein